MSEKELEQVRAWVANWKQTGVELDRIKGEELQAMDEEASAEIFNRLGMGWVDDWQNPERPPGIGLVLQQAYFARAHAAT
jgi:hypothetical protein